MSSGPNPAVAAWSMIRARRLSPPTPLTTANAGVDHSGLADVLEACLVSGPSSLPANLPALEDYRDDMESVEPDALNAAESLAFWINLYNAGALWTAGQAFSEDVGSVLRVPGAFSKPWATVGGQKMSLDDIEHGKIRRYGDPRIHGALVCGSVSCPTLRSEPFVGVTLDAQLDDQMRYFISHGGGSVSPSENIVRLSSVFKWYGRDFTSPHTMPNLAPPEASRLRDTVAYWFPESDAEYIWAEAPQVEFLSYDWGLGCSIA